MTIPRHARPKRSLPWTAAGLLLLCLVEIAHADTIWLKPSGGGGASLLQMANTKVLRIEQDQIRFITSLGSETSRPLAQVARLAIDDERDFTAAEQAFDAEDWDAAIDGYQRTLKGTSRAWLKDWCAPRLLHAANQASRFDAAATAYVTLLLRDPAAAPKLPPMPDAGSDYLNLAVADVTRALDEPKLTDPQRLSLLTFLLDLHRARKDLDAAATVAQRLAALNPAQANDPSTIRAVAELKLAEARSSLQAKSYQKAIDHIQADAGLFRDPALQVEALFCLAEAQAALAAQKGNDPPALKDAAMAYMRVVAHAGSLPGKPHVAEALLKTAAIHEKLNEPQTALRLYEQVASEFRGQAPAADAQQQAQRLRSSASPRKAD